MKRPRPHTADDAGFTLIEVVITMSILSLVMTIFTGGVLQMYRAANKNDATTTALAQNNIAFLRLDKEIRYATGISKQGALNGDQYVEYLTTNTGVAICTALRLTSPPGNQLITHAWILGNTPAAWVVLASGVTSVQPFTFWPADAIFNFQRLQLRLVTSSGAGTTATLAETDITFTALNTSLSTSSATVCTDMRGIPW
jgi:prepilin-type N-terminal cleavage/methylation domain-containing protein